jgi:hypothetical protein
VRTQGPIDAASIAIMLDVRPRQIVGAFATSKVACVPTPPLASDPVQGQTVQRLTVGRLP